MFIDKNNIAQTLSMAECIAIMEELFSMDFEKETINPLRAKMFLPSPSDGILGTMTGYIQPYNLMGVKVLSVFANNYKKGISSHQGILHLFETHTGQLLASLDADEITAIRTAAVSALATKILSKENAQTLCLIGSGKQARKHLEAMQLVRPITKVNIWSKNKANALKLKAAIAEQYNITITVFDTVVKAAANADIICTMTAAETPVLNALSLKPDVHINAIGACNADVRELTTDVILSSKVFVDDYYTASNEAGDLIIPTNEGYKMDELITGDLSSLVKNKDKQQQSQRTVFKSVGLAIEDIAAGYYCYKKAKKLFFITNSCN